MTPPACANGVPTASSPRPPAPLPFGEAEERAARASGRILALMVTEEEAEALMTVLLLAPLESGRSGDTMECVLSKLADVQRAFSRQE